MEESNSSDVLGTSISSSRYAGIGYESGFSSSVILIPVVRNPFLWSSNIFKSIFIPLANLLESIFLLMEIFFDCLNLSSSVEFGLTSNSDGCWGLADLRVVSFFGEGASKVFKCIVLFIQFSLHTLFSNLTKDCRFL